MLNDQIKWTIFGFSACFTLACGFLMSPPQMVRWVLAAGSNEQKVEAALSTPFDQVALEKKLLEAQQNAPEAQNKGSNEVHAEPTAVKHPDEFNRTVALASAETVLNGQLHIYVSDVVLGGCRFTVATENGMLPSNGFYVPSSSIQIETASGPFRVVLRSANFFWLPPLIWPSCQFDVVRVVKHAVQ